MQRADHVTVLQHTVTNDAAAAHSTTAVVANVVRQDVVAGIVEDLVLREEVHLEAAEVGPRLQVSGVPVAIARHGVITDDEPVGVGRNEPALQRDSVQRREEHVLVVQAVLIRPPQDRRAG
jgi:hypothetical protein